MTSLLYCAKSVHRQPVFRKHLRVKSFSVAAKPGSSEKVSPELAHEFNTDGAVLIRNLLTHDEVLTLKNGIDRHLRSPTHRALVASSPDDPGWFFEDFCAWDKIPEYRMVLSQSDMGRTAAALMNSDHVRLFHDHLLVKEPGTRQATPWHQDQPYYNIDGQRNVSFWIPVDPVLRPSSPEFVAGTHLGPWLMPRTFMEKAAKWFPEGSLADLPDYDNERTAHRILSWDLQPGDAVAFHMLTVHAAAGTPPDGPRRRAWSARFLGDDMVHAPRKWTTSPDFPGLASELPAGRPLNHRLFPLVWPLQSESLRTKF